MKKYLFVSFLLLTSIVSRAHDFEVDGIYYNITSAKKLTAAVTYRGESEDNYTDRYSGNVVIPESVTYGTKTYKVTSIGDGAFGSCKGLTSVSIGNNVTEIGGGTFFDSGLTSIIIPESVKVIAYSTFWNCNNLERIVVAAGNSVYDSRDNCNAIIETSSNTLISGCKNTVIPNSVTAIGEAALMSCRTLTSITIPNSVKTIAKLAFYYCDSLTSITIPSSVSFIGEEAFGACVGLERIVVAANNSVYDSRDNCNAIIKTSSNTLVSGCKNTVIPNSVTEIGCAAFVYCSDMTSMIIPDNVKKIGKEAFFGCSSLKDVYCFAERVPATGKDIFKVVDLSSVALHVPATSLQAYRKKSPWRSFGKLDTAGR